VPHCILEYSCNVADQVDPRQVLLDLHEVLAATGEFNRADIKGRAIEHQVFVVGDGAQDRAFVSLNLAILDGRSDELKTRISEQAAEILKRAFARTLAERRCSLTVQVSEMHRPSYQKIVSGTS